MRPAGCWQQRHGHVALDLCCRNRSINRLRAAVLIAVQPSAAPVIRGAFSFSIITWSMMPLPKM
jgi:hypothetical protein